MIDCRAEQDRREAAPLLERIARPSGRERRCVGCGRHIRPDGLAGNEGTGGALANWCRRCHPHRTTRPAIDTLVWCGVGPIHPAAAAVRRPRPVLPPRTTLRERLKARRGTA